MDIRVFLDKEEGVYEVAIWDGEEWRGIRETSNKEELGYELRVAKTAVKILKNLRERRLTLAGQIRKQEEKE